MNKSLISYSREETHAIAKKFSQTLKAGDIIIFFGNLGSGKTTFIQGLAKGLKIEKRIISPTFIIVRHYKINKDNNLETFYHIDLYRTETRNDLIGIGIDQILKDKDNIVAIEWGEKLGDLIPNKYTKITLTAIGENERKISIEKYE